MELIVSLVPELVTQRIARKHGHDVTADRSAVWSLQLWHRLFYVRNSIQGPFKM